MWVLLLTLVIAFVWGGIYHGLFLLAGFLIAAVLGIVGGAIRIVWFFFMVWRDSRKLQQD